MRRGRGPVACGVALVLSGALLTGQAEAGIVICKRKNAIKLRQDQCKKKETLVEATELGVAGPSGQNGMDGMNGANGANGMDGMDGVDGVAGTARAYAQVNDGSGSPSFVAARTSNFTAITRVGTGNYCLTLDPALGIDTTTVAAVASVEFGNTTGTTDPSVRIRGVSTISCDNTQINVRTQDSNADSDDVSFMVIVP